MKSSEFLPESSYTKTFIKENKAISSFAKNVKNQLGLKEFFLYQKGNDIFLDTLIVGKENQGKGLGTKALEILTQYADENQNRIILTPAVKDTMHGTTSRARLVKFYKQFGFKESKGKHIDYAIGGGKMYRDPQIKEYSVDNKDGLGAVPNNANVDYFGLQVLMKPSTFLSLAKTLHSPRNSVDYIRNHLKRGGKLGSPYLDVDIPLEWEHNDFSSNASITGHEGRHRMLAVLQEEGDKPVEVHIFPRRGMRARHITSEMIKQLNVGLVNQDGKYKTGPFFKLL